MVAKTEDRVALNIRKVPRDLRARLRAYCVRHSKDMQDVVVDVLSDFLMDSDRLPSRAPQPH